MKKVYLIFAATLFFSCSGNPKDVLIDGSFSLTFDVDTVMVDAGEDFIYLKNWLRTADISSDANQLLNFNSDENLLEVIDLEKLRLEKKLSFEQEGPNGTGNVSGFRQLDDKRFLISTYFSFGIFEDGGQRNTFFDLAKFQPKNVYEAGRVTADGVWVEEEKAFVTFYTRGLLHNRGLAKVYPGEGRFERIPIQHVEDLDRFATEIPSPYSISATAAQCFISEFEGKVLVSSSASNDLLVFDPQTDSLDLHVFESQITPNMQKEAKRRVVETREELERAIEERQKDVKFGKWVFDTSSERFYRLTHLPREGSESKIILTILDREFQQLYEGLTPLKRPYATLFFRNGQLYLFENINDELAFIVLTINEA